MYINSNNLKEDILINFGCSKKVNYEVHKDKIFSYAFLHEFTYKWEF